VGILMGDNGHDAFDLDGEGETIAMFPESQEEKDAREAFYKTTPDRRREQVDGYIHSIKLSGSLRLEDKLENCDLVSVTFADADGQVIAAGMAEIGVGFKKHKGKDATIEARNRCAELGTVRRLLSASSPHLPRLDRDHVDADRVRRSHAGLRWLLGGRREGQARTMNAPAANRHRLALARAVPSGKGGGSVTREMPTREAVSSGRRRNSAGGGNRLGIAGARKLG
jgi:hypothetical protein